MLTYTRARFWIGAGAIALVLTVGWQWWFYALAERMRAYHAEITAAAEATASQIRR